MSDELRRALYSSGASIDMEFSPPDLIGTSEILTMEHRLFYINFYLSSVFYGTLLSVVSFRNFFDNHLTCAS